jgi:hypothetical protein
LSTSYIPIDGRIHQDSAQPCWPRSAVTSLSVGGFSRPRAQPCRPSAQHICGESPARVFTRCAYAQLIRKRTGSESPLFHTDQQFSSQHAGTPLGCPAALVKATDTGRTQRPCHPIVSCSCRALHPHCTSIAPTHLHTHGREVHGERAHLSEGSDCECQPESCRCPAEPTGRCRP